ncbi:aminopeptidase P family protein [Frankia sp. CNm7]|uniref:Aminopeptidase P family protein n=1 Tax=Frankia nepalensis TaxID=1836974 RepID=A0A937RMK1_9ACTN|nr:Xaa-Pro peptidase family protein [Frankia nepalensis]MBL7495584.1 aminopeptidase P family protein [Frankia nepalensis]MBL7508830.1 aminopeptidase P family protein [Frankia nepalensis]MBL7523957.1 aminopeptidase P family protein [Frankia nepalensis]MBL7630054.1 aminopeptidase P family protein [Frankia nepalensis]
MTPPFRELDLPRMHRERHRKLQDLMAAEGLGALFLLTSGGVLYATGANPVQGDNNRVYQQRAVALVVAGAEHPHLFTAWPDAAPADLPADHVHPCLQLETEEGVVAAAARIRELTGGRGDPVAVDDYTAPMYLRLPALLAPSPLAPAGPLLVAARLHKTPDEVECMRRSWEINEAATHAAERALRPGIRLNELSGPFYERLFELGATCNFLDPVWQAMPPRISDGPWSVNGDIPFNLITNDHVVREGDVIWTDTVTGYEGYASDVGRTWVCGRPSPTLRGLYRRWQDITDAVLEQLRPGVSGAELVKLATSLNDGRRPWLDHFFLGHTLGLEGGESQQIGSDRGPEFDERFVLEPGMAIVIEPVTWQEGHAGWRCEELVVITPDGHERISRYPNEIDA